MRRLHTFAFLCSALMSAAPAFAVSTTLVISEFRTRGPNGANDEFVEIFNKSGATVAAGGFMLRAADAAGNTAALAQIPAGTNIASKHFYLFANNGTQGYSGSVSPNQTYTQSIPDSGGIAILNASSVIIDAVGTSATSAYVEGTPLAPMTANVNQSYERNDGGCAATQDTDDNAADFRFNAASSGPQNSSFNCSSCSGVVCDSPPNSQCWATAGTCSAGTCNYKQSATGTSCSDGDACTVGDSCDSSGNCASGSAAVCNSPPANACSDPQTLVTYSPAGVCSSLAGCTYQSTSTQCPFGCNGSTAQCNPDPCTNVSCTTPPTNGCYAAGGTCSKGSCTYLPNPALTPCTDGNACTVGDQCDGSGTCEPGTAKPIDDGNPCTLDSCDTTTGVVSHTNEDGTNCDDGNLCNGVATCVAGVCTNGAPVACTTPPIGGCYAATGTCAPTSGACTYPPLSQGTACDDGEKCTSQDQCDGSGACKGSTVVCTPGAPTCSDANTSTTFSGGTCQSGNGTCSFTSKNTACAFGCNAASGLCNADPCIGVVCNTPPAGLPSDLCLSSTGTCSGGTCTYPLKASGASCDDGDPCTGNDQCSSAGKCAGTPLLCNTPPNPVCKDSGTSTQASVNGTCTAGSCGYVTADVVCQFGCDGATGLCKGDPCATVTCDQPPLDGCHQAQGTCTNGSCAYDLKPSGSSCDDGNACTENDVCDDTGTCAGAALECNTPPASTCSDANTSVAYASAGTCGAGTCAYAPTSTACPNGCDATTGLCKGDPCASVTCATPPGACFLDTGTCAGGTCTYSPRQSGVPCDDGNACTAGDECDGAGNCVPASTVCGDGGPKTDGGPGPAAGGAPNLDGGVHAGGASSGGAAASDGGPSAGGTNTGGAAGGGGGAIGGGGVGGFVNLPDGGLVPEGGTGFSNAGVRGGCGCSVPDTRSRAPWPLSLLALGAIVLRRRRRRAA